MSWICQSFQSRTEVQKCMEEMDQNMPNSNTFIFQRILINRYYLNLEFYWCFVLCIASVKCPKCKGNAHWNDNTDILSQKILFHIQWVYKNTSSCTSVPMIIYTCRGDIIVSKCKNFTSKGQSRTPKYWAGYEAMIKLCINFNICNALRCCMLNFSPGNYSKSKFLAIEICGSLYFMSGTFRPGFTLTVSPGYPRQPTELPASE